MQQKDPKNANYLKISLYRKINLTEIRDFETLILNTDSTAIKGTFTFWRTVATSNRHISLTWQWSFIHTRDQRGNEALWIKACDISVIFPLTWITSHCLNLLQVRLSYLILSGSKRCMLTVCNRPSELKTNTEPSDVVSKIKGHRVIL